MTSSLTHEEAATFLRHIEGEIVIVFRRHNQPEEEQSQDKPKSLDKPEIPVKTRWLLIKMIKKKLT